MTPPFLPYFPPSINRLLPRSPSPYYARGHTNKLTGRSGMSPTAPPSPVPPRAIKTDRHRGKLHAHHFPHSPAAPFSLPYPANTYHSTPLNPVSPQLPKHRRRRTRVEGMSAAPPPFPPSSPSSPNSSLPAPPPSPCPEHRETPRHTGVDGMPALVTRLHVTKITSRCSASPRQAARRQGRFGPHAGLLLPPEGNRCEGRRGGCGRSGGRGVGT